VSLARRAIDDLERLNAALGDTTSAHWLRGMIDMLHVYADDLPRVPDKILTAHSADSVILRRGLQSFVVSESEFSEVRNAFRRCKHYQKKRDIVDGRRKVTSFSS
jgi:hypothetical protein